MAVSIATITHFTGTIIATSWIILPEQVATAVRSPYQAGRRPWVRIPPRNGLLYFTFQLSLIVTLSVIN